MLRAWRSLPPYGSAVVAACFTVAVTFLVHGSLDWVDEIPALIAPALGFVLIASRLAARGEAEKVGRPRVGLVAGTLAATAFAIAVIGVSWLSVLYLERASDRLGVDSAGAFEDIDRAKSLEPWSARPLLIEGVSAIEVGDSRRAREAFADSLDREETAFAHLELGLLAAQRGIERRHESRSPEPPPSNPETSSPQRPQAARGRKKGRSPTFNQRLLGIERRRFASPVN